MDGALLGVRDTVRFKSGASFWCMSMYTCEIFKYEYPPNAISVSVHSVQRKFDEGICNTDARADNPIKKTLNSRLDL